MFVRLVIAPGPREVSEVLFEWSKWLYFMPDDWKRMQTENWVNALIRVTRYGLHSSSPDEANF